MRHAHKRDHRDKVPLFLKKGTLLKQRHLSFLILTFRDNFQASSNNATPLMAGSLMYWSNILINILVHLNFSSVCFPNIIHYNNPNIVSVISQNYVVALRSNQTFCQQPYKNVNSWFLKHVWQWKSFTSFTKGGEVSRRSMWQLVQNESDHIVYNIIFNQHNEDTFYYKEI